MLDRRLTRRNGSSRRLTRLVDEAPAGHGWVHEIKYDDYRMHARIDGGKATLLTRTVLSLPQKTAKPNVTSPKQLMVGGSILKVA